MFHVLPGVVRGSLSLALYILNTLFWCIPLFMLVLAKEAVPLESWMRRCSRMLNAIAENWIWVNNQNQKLVGNTRWDVQGMETMERSEWYLVLANHQSWVDILVLQRIFHRKIPFLKFFIKKELFWFPVLDQAWWAMDFPFVRRYTKSYLQKKPHLKGKDLEITRKACKKFKKMPVSIMNFVEGTRVKMLKELGVQNDYDPVITSDIDGPNARAKRIDERMARETPALASVKPATRIATSILLYSFGGLRRAIRYLLAIERVEARKQQLRLTKDQLDQLKERKRTEQAAAESCFRELYTAVWLPRVVGGELELEKAERGGRSLQATGVHERIMELLTSVVGVAPGQAITTTSGVSSALIKINYISPTSPLFCTPSVPSEMCHSRALRISLKKQCPTMSRRPGNSGSVHWFLTSPVSAP